MNHNNGGKISNAVRQNIYGTFDNSLIAKSQFEEASKIMERGSSVGDQFYTIDNTVKENLNI